MEPINLFDMEAKAKLRLSRGYWDWVAGGATDEITVGRNREAFEEISVRSRVLVDTTNRDLSTTMLGERISFPVFACPAGTQWIAHPDAEVAVAKAAGSIGTLMGVATGAHKTIEEIAAVATAPLWYQLYHITDDVTEHLVSKAEDAGYSAICLTVSGSDGGGRERNLRNNYLPDAGPAWGDIRPVPALMKQIDARNPSEFRGLTWERLAWLRKITSLPIVIKEILTPEDARLCVDHGVSGIVVSNHGGRSFDTEQATIEVLPSIVEEVGSEIEVYLDSGIRRGVDVLKALALGARAVGVGRPLFWGLAIDGATGVETMFELLRQEFSRAMAICGCMSVNDIDESLVVLPSQRWKMNQNS